MIITLPKECFQLSQSPGWSNWFELSRWLAGAALYDHTRIFLEKLKYDRSFRFRFIQFLHEVTQYEAVLIQELQEIVPTLSGFDIEEFEDQLSDMIPIQLPEPAGTQFNHALGSWQGLRKHLSSEFKDISDFANQLENNLEVRQLIMTFLQDVSDFEQRIAEAYEKGASHETIETGH